MATATRPYLTLIKGKPKMYEYTPASAVTAGDVVELGSMPVVAHLDIAASALGEVAIEGGIYKGMADGAMSISNDVYWDATNNKFTLTVAANTYFGKVVAGPLNDMVSAGPAADGDDVYVLHAPLGATTGGGAGGVEMVNTAISTVGAGTLTAAGIVGQLITRTGSTADFTDTTATAALILAEIPGAAIGDSWLLFIVNDTAFVETLSAGATVTLAGESVIPPNSTGIFQVRKDSATAVTIRGIGLIPKTGDDENLSFGDADAQMLWSTGDASNHALVLALGDSNQALHITDKGAKATDWNVAADTHPTLYVHSNTTPATDYLLIGAHDGTKADIDVVGGTTLNLKIAGSTKAAVIDGILFMGDTADANLTTGLCINQGAADDGVMSFKSSDVAHGITDEAETDSYALFKKFAAADGGLKIASFSDATVALEIFAIGATADATDAPTTTSTATITLNGGKLSGTAAAALAATENLLNVENVGTAEFIVKGDGELYSNQSATVGTFDDHDDALMAADLSYVLSHEYGKVVAHNRQLFERLGILGPLDENGQGMYSITKMAMLTLCAIGQLGRQIATLAGLQGVKLLPNGGLLQPIEG